MAIIQDKSFKDRLLIVETNLVGNKDRGIEPYTPNNATIYGNPITFHPAVRDNWGTEDPLRGVMGSYYARYTSTAGPALENYSGIVRRLQAGELPGSTDQGPGNIGRLRDQFSPVGGPGYKNTNLIFSIEFNENDDTLFLERQIDGWVSYQDVSITNGNWAIWILQNFEEYVEGPSLQVPNLDGNPLIYNGLLGPFNFVGKSFTDHTSLHYLISSDSQIREAAGLTTNISPVYNYYVSSEPAFESVIADARVKEYHIPNAYYLQLESRNTSSTYLENYHKIAITVNNVVPWFNSISQAIESNSEIYYNLYSRKVSQFIDSLDMVQPANKDIAVLHSDLPVLTDGYLEKNSIPFYNQITVGYDTDKDVSGPNATPFLTQIYNDSDTRDFIDLLQGYAIASYYYQDSALNAEFSTREKIVTNATTGDYQFNSQDLQYRILFDFAEVIKNRQLENTAWPDFIQNRGEGLLNLPVKFLRDYFGKEVINPDAYSLIESVENVSIDYFNNGLPSLDLEAYKRTMEQVFLNQTCHTETLMYVVEKYRVAPPDLARIQGDELVQRFFISPKMTPSAPLDITYYDSQIKYNQKYRYEFKKIVLIFGNDYQYNLVNAAQTQSIGVVTVKYNNKLSIKAVLVPYSYDGIETAVMDKPPVSPNISFYPIKGEDREVIILMQPTTGDYMDTPVAILDEDKKLIEEEYFSQEGKELSFNIIRFLKKKIRYKSDDPVDKFQLFKIDFEPSSYSDFNGNLLEIDPDVGTSGYYRDTILPNKKYYYCARSVDVHGNISNPTYIFEIEMFNNEGQIYLRQSIFKFKKNKASYSKNGRRFIYIEPSFQQTVLESEVAAPTNTDEAPPDSILGADGVNKVWTQGFKVRVTSKKTGRKIDLNLTFNNSGITKQS